MNGNCKIYFGPMFSGKTTELCKDLTMYSEIGFKTLYITHSIDERGGDEILTTHNKSYNRLSNKVDHIKTPNLDINVDNYEVIGIDEAQFFNDDILKVREWVKYKKVIISSLDGDFNMNNFGSVYKLVSICDSNNLIKLGAKCHKCLDNNMITTASFTKKIIKDDNIIDIGGKDKYIAVCRYHH